MNRLKKLVFALCFFFLASGLFAQTKTIRVGFAIPKDPHLGTYYGYEYEYFQELSKLTGWKYEFVTGSKNDYIKWLKSGEIDIMIDYPSITDHTYFTQSDRPFMSTDCYIFRSIHNYSISGDYVFTMQGAKIGVVKNSSSEYVLRDYQIKSGLNFEFVYFTSLRTLMENFYSPNTVLDAISLSDYFIKDYDGVVAVTKIGYIDLYVIFNKDNKDLIHEFNRTQQFLNERSPYFTRKLKERTYEFRNPSGMPSRLEEQWLKNHNELVVGYIGEAFPFCITTSDGSHAGLLPRYLHELLARLKLQNLIVNYQCLNSYEEAIAALKGGQIDLLFPFYGEYYEAEKYDLQKTDDVLRSHLELLYKKTTSKDKIKKIYTYELFDFVKLYCKQYLSSCEIIQGPFSINDKLDSILDDETAIILSEGTINVLSSNSKLRNVIREPLKNDCPIAFSVRRDDIGLLNLMDRGISLVGEVYAESILTDIGYASQKYSFSDFVSDNLAIVFMTILGIFLLIGFVVAMYVRTINYNKKKIEIAKHEVEQALQVAKVASNAKSNFLNNMSHDIRTPMNAIMGYTEMAQKTAKNGGDVSPALEKIQISSKHLLNLINDVLDMSRIESGKVVIEEGSYDVFVLTEELETIIKTDITQKNLQLNVDLSGVHNRYVRCDRLRMNQIFLNLLSNAIKFTPEGGKIDFIISDSESNIAGKRKYQIIVNDNGIGMSEEFQKVLYDAFERENNTTISKIQGTGLGMAITKKLVDMMRGTIQVESKKDTGTTFTLEFDLTVVDEISVEDEKAKVSISKVNVNNFMNKKVLLVEDNVLNQEITTSILNEFGFIVDTADNGEQAVQKIKAVYQNAEKRYDVVLMDVQMPVMDGYEATKQIRAIQDEYVQKLPILAMTANAFEEDKRAAFASGMNAHIPKPIDANELVKTIWMSLE